MLDTWNTGVNKVGISLPCLHVIYIILEDSDNKREHAQVNMVATAWRWESNTMTEMMGEEHYIRQSGWERFCLADAFQLKALKKIAGQRAWGQHSRQRVQLVQVSLTPVTGS